MAFPFLNSTIRGRLGNYTLAVQSADDLGSHNIEVVRMSPLRYGKSRLGYSPYVLASFIEVVYYDPTGLVRDTFNSIDDELDYTVNIASTDGTFNWNGAVRRGLVGRPVGVRVHKQQTSVYYYDRLATLKDIQGVSFLNVTLALSLGNIFEKVLPNIDIDSHIDLICTNTTEQQSWGLRRFKEELVGGTGGGDYGTALQQIEAVARSHGLLLFMNTTTGKFAFFHRASMPFQRTSATTMDAGASYIETYDVLRTPVVISPELSGRRQDKYVTNQGTGTIFLENAGAIDWVVDGGFYVIDADPGGDGLGTDFTYWTRVDRVSKNYGTDRVITGTGGGSTEQFLGSFSPEADVRPRFMADYRGTNVKVELRLEAPGTTYWLDSSGLWQTTYQEWSFTSTVLTQLLVIAQSGEDFPAAGDLYVKLSNAGSLAQWGDCEMYLVDAAGALIDDWLFSVGTGEGATVTLEAVPELEIGPGPIYADAEYQSELTEIVFESINDYMVSDRLAQDVPNNDNLSGGLFAIAGPEAVLQLTNDRGTEQYFVANGANIDLVGGITNGVWLALDDLTATGS